jgi:hypothetical protein
MPERNYLLGHGENLVTPLDPPRGGGTKAKPYSFDENRRHLAEKANEVSRGIDALPESACPSDQVVVLLTLHPGFIAKTHSPLTLLSAAGFYMVGSRTIPDFVPRKWGVPNHPNRSDTTALYVGGPRSRFRDFPRLLESWSEESPAANDVVKIEDIRITTVTERIKTIDSISANTRLEVVLQGAGLAGNLVLNGFQRHLNNLRLNDDVSDRIEATGLLFVSVGDPKGRVMEIANYTFVRALRAMPRLRPIGLSGQPSRDEPPPFYYRLPTESPVDPTIRAAVCDGGLPSDHPFGQWARAIDAPGVGTAVAEFQSHGLAVTSALLFGPIIEGQEIERPFAPVDHYRVVGSEYLKDPFKGNYAALRRITNILQTKTYEFACICLGPDMAIDDDDIDPWTATLDPILSRGEPLVVVAAGNGGERPKTAGLNRIQPPADCANVLAVGACDHYIKNHPWGRAPYSSVGPGRSPGRVRPDTLFFGGTEETPYWIAGGGRLGLAQARFGTSLAAPTALRSILGLRAHLGAGIRPLTFKALVIHRSEDDELPRDEIGWGRGLTSIGDLATCPRGIVHVVYQGQLLPKQYVRAKIPVPKGELPGKVRITATICIGTDTDPDHPSEYTRSGIEVFLRPDSRKLEEGATHPKTRRFVTSRTFRSEGELRKDAHKWEPVVCEMIWLKGSKVFNPTIDLHHLVRFKGADTRGAAPINYAMIITVYAPDVVGLYNRVLNQFRGLLVPLRPTIDIPVRL